ncbi:Type I inositol 1,4,5-trisphosphate 5-phosphatase [Trichinella pseudospiralis]|uniref:inositol-polyphosphate 5-phosphatase n=1 Tax=Trichinella pseudospiralis TaxID=6337 RepID=A0A0V0Y1V2_TRIPS|nr:Type I inositol 1,4,5-trisphosphate 5-phosphatase [Trichinella pseudospiralis]
MSDYQAVIKRLQSEDRVTGVILIDKDGRCIQTTVNEELTNQFVSQLHPLINKARNVMKEFDSANELNFFHIRAKKHEPTWAQFLDRQLEHLQAGWFLEIVKVIESKSPKVLAIHFQEIGGKEFKENMHQMKHFFQKLYTILSEKFNLRRGLGYYDEDFTNVDTFTALGLLYLFHDDVKEASVYNFQTGKFESIQNFTLTSDTVALPHFYKLRFSKELFPKSRPSRKGFLQCRLQINGLVIDLVNIHLFHDACNIEAVESSPSIFAKKRENGLKFVLQQLHQEKNCQIPMVLFGDFNFRLDTKCLIEEVLAPSSVAVQMIVEGDDGKPNLQYRDLNSGENLVEMKTKLFNHKLNVGNIQSDNLERLYKLDREPLCHTMLHEFPIQFVPSYPFSENINCGKDYMYTRAPAWCDRILLNEPAWMLANSVSSSVCYDIVGKDTCMGDHKPVCLGLPFPIGNSSSLLHNEIAGSSQNS